MLLPLSKASEQGSAQLQPREIGCANALVLRVLV